MLLGILVVQESGGCGSSHDFLLVEWLLSSIKEPLVTTKKSMPLLHCQGYCAMLVVVVVDRYHRQVGLLVVFLFEILHGASGTMKSSPRGGSIQVSFSSWAHQGKNFKSSGNLVEIITLFDKMAFSKQSYKNNFQLIFNLLHENSVAIQELV